MYPITLFSIINLVAFANAHAAPESRDSALDDYHLVLFKDKVRGGVVIYSTDGYVSVNVALGLPEEGGPFLYQIHEKRVDEHGDCSATGGMFNPYDGLELATDPADMDVGDLSKKHGMLEPGLTFEIYEDKYMSLNRTNEAYVGNLSLVIADAEGKPVSCNNIFSLKDSSHEDKKLARKLVVPPQVAHQFD